MKGEYVEKTAVLSTRITPELRQRLEEAAKASGSTLSREIEHRLRRTFKDDATAAEGFGTRRNRALMKMLCLATGFAWNPERPDAEWLDDPWLFDQVVKTLNNLLEAVRPSGPVQPPADPALEVAARIKQQQVAAKAWFAVQNADASLPLDATPRQNLLDRIKSDLGEIAERPNLVFGTADQLRAAAAKELEDREQEPAADADKPSLKRRKPV